MDFDSSHYLLQCSLCGAEYAAEPLRLECDMLHAPALLKTVYRKPRLEINRAFSGIFQFSDWLPIARVLEVSGQPITYHSVPLGDYLGLPHLYVVFNGYWPQREAGLMTGSFKELEAPCVLARVPESYGKTLVIASAGNTGRAFATLCSKLQIPLCLVIPEQSLSSIWSTEPFHPCIKLIVVQDGDYTDAIALASQISQRDGFFPGGGAANVARRDGMGLTVVDATLTLGQIPHHYVQAVGSGSGGIAAWEANRRLIGDGRFGPHRMQVHLAQNVPFTPMVDAWKAGMDQIDIGSEAIAKARIGQTAAMVLTNRNPAYAIAGGVYDALVDTGGHMYAVTNNAARQAQHLFESLEGMDICPASGVATAALIQAVTMNRIAKDDVVLLNITSGGIRQIQQDYHLHEMEPTLAVSRHTPLSAILKALA